MKKKSNNFNKIEKKIRRLAGKAIKDFNLIDDNDKVMVCVSGGKDSYTLLDVLIYFQKIAPINFELVAVNLDQYHPGFPKSILPNYFKESEIPYKIVSQNTYKVVKEKIPDGKTMCGLCSRLRRGILYKTASDIGATKIALGHHRNDIIETFFLNIFFSGRIKSMPPKLLSDDKKNVVIRPLAYCEERDIKKYSNQKNFPIIPCNLCGSQEKLQRVQIKKMINQWEKDYPDRIQSIFKSIQTVEISHLLDKNIFNFNDFTSSV